MRRGLRFPLAALATCVFASAAAAVSVRVEPGPAAPGVQQYAHFQNESANPCVTWRLLGIDGEGIVLIGLAPTSGEPCPSMEQYVPLGVLASGHYTLAARIEATGAAYARITFLIGGDPFPNVAAVLPTRPSTDSPVSFGLSLLNNICNRVSFASPPRVESDRVTIEGEFLYFPFTCPPTNWFEGFFFTIPGLSPGLKTVEFVIEDQVLARMSFTVAEPTSTLFLSDHFRVQVTWQDRDGGEHESRGIQLTEESGTFTFFDPENVELVVKILDGRELNGHFWVFAASMTDLAYTLSVTEYLGTYCDVVSPPCPNRQYRGPAGVNRNVLDTRAFAAH